MAKFIGTIKDFKYYFDGFCKNTVNKFTRSYKNELNKKCQYGCGGEHTLEAAHIANRERVKIIEDVLDKNFTKHDNVYHVEMKTFEKLFIEAHMPIEDNFYFLCRECHNKYDRGEIRDEQIICKMLENYQEKLEKVRQQK